MGAALGVVVGTPDTICRNIKTFQDVGVTQILCGTQYPGITQEQAIASMRLFGREVIPRFREAGAPANVPAEIAVHPSINDAARPALSSAR